MKLDELPRALMAEHLSNPRQEALDKLFSCSIPQKILQKYRHVEDIADAFDGAFTAFHVHAHLSRGGDKETWLEEALYWYAVEGHRDPNGPFFSTLRKTLDAFSVSNFYNEIEDYIIKKRGKI